MEVGATVAATATVSVGSIGMSVGCGVVEEHADNTAASAANGIQFFMSGFSLSVWALVISGMNNPRAAPMSCTHALLFGHLIVKRGMCAMEVSILLKSPIGHHIHHRQSVSIRHFSRYRFPSPRICGPQASMGHLDLLDRPMRL